VDEEGYESLVELPSRKKASALPKKDTHSRSAKPQGPQIPKPTQHRTRSASVEVVDDDEIFHRSNVGRPRDPSVILESMEDDEYESPVERNPKRKSSTSTRKLPKAVGKSVKADEEGLQENADEAELGM